MPVVKKKKLKFMFVLCSETNKTDWEQKSLDKAIG